MAVARTAVPTVVPTAEPTVALMAVPRAARERRRRSVSGRRAGGSAAPRVFAPRSSPAVLGPAVPLLPRGRPRRLTSPVSSPRTPPTNSSAPGGCAPRSCAIAKDGPVVRPHASRLAGAGADDRRPGPSDAVLRLFADGGTVVLQGLHRTCAPVIEFADQLAADLGHPTQVNAYITPPSSRGSLPLRRPRRLRPPGSGRKRWRVHEPVLLSPMPAETWQQRAAEVRARAEDAPIIDTDLRPGDCLYLPRGFVHSAVAHGETSIHLTFGIHASTQRDVLEAVFASVKEQGWRAALPARWDPGSADGMSRLAAVIEDLRDALGQADLSDVAARLADGRARQQRPEPVPPLAQAAAAVNLTADTTVRLRRWLGVRWSAEGLVAAGRTVPVKPEDRAAAEVLLQGESVRVGQLPGTADGPPFALVAEWLRAGILVTDTL